ncbi:MAG: hypothetical protein ACPGOV_04310 [Magnetovibrionaceae bacterium]
MKRGLLPRREAAFLTFEKWCKDRRLSALPAHPWTVAAYCRWVAARRGLKPLGAVLESIGRAHLFAGLQAPDQATVVRRTLESLNRAAEAKAQRADLFEDGPSSPKSTSPEAKGPGTKSSGKRGLKGLAMAPKLRPRRPANSNRPT